MKTFFSSHKTTIVVVGIIFVAAFARLYHFSDWMHFEVDQARDARVVAAAVQNGPGELPLQGPRAAGSFLRLGPAYYYLNYASALLFGNTPSGMAALIALSSVASVFVLYLFLVRRFAKTIALFLAAIAAVSPFFVLYGRFLWNPNFLPFFTIFGLYALLRAVDTEETYQARWLAAAAASIAIATQMHFLALVVLALVAVIFLVIVRPRVSLWAFLGAAAAVLFVYSPIIVNDALTGGENTKEFLEAVSGASEDAKHTRAEQLFRAAGEYTAAYTTMLTGYEQVDIPRTVPRSGWGFDIQCDALCRASFPIMSAAGIVFLLGGILLMWLLWRRVRGDVCFRNNDRKRNFLLLVFVWLAVSFVVFIPVSFDLAPRFFLVSWAVPFVLLGLAAEKIAAVLHARWFAVLALGLIVFSNVYLLGDRLYQLQRSSSEAVETAGGDKILKESARVTLGQEEVITDMMKAAYEENGFPVFYYSEAHYRRAFGYLLARRAIPNETMRADSVWREGNYFLIWRTNSDFMRKSEKYLKNFSLVETRQFGTLTALVLAPKTETITGEKKKDIGDTGNFTNFQRDDRVQKRYIWSEAVKEISSFKLWY